MTEVVIVAAKRTPFGRFQGTLSGLSAVDLGCAAGEAVLHGIDRSQIDLTIVGNVLSAGQGMNIARQIGVRLGLNIETPAYTVNMMCASGLQSILLAAQSIRAGEAHCVLCGGTESMSNAPFLLAKARAGYKLGDGVLIDSLLRDGLVDSFDHQHMGLSAERLASEYRITRQSQDEFAVQSQTRFAASAINQQFDREIIATSGLNHDEHPRSDTTLERLGKLKPAFDPAGTVTAGNSSGINDGAAMLLLANRDYARNRGWPILATLSDGTVQGCDPQRMGLGPVHAIRKLCSKRCWNLSEFDAIEINEAFAVQTLACQHELKIDPAKLNLNGGAIAVGHPIGASGARLAVHLVHRIAAHEIRSGLASLCVGGGMGIAAAFTKFTH